MEAKLVRMDPIDMNFADYTEVLAAEQAFWSDPARKYCAPAVDFGAPWYPVSCNDDVVSDNIPY